MHGDGAHRLVARAAPTRALTVIALLWSSAGCAELVGLDGWQARGETAGTAGSGTGASGAGGAAQSSASGGGATGAGGAGGCELAVCLPEVLAVGQGLPTHMTTDASGVYWVTFDQHSVVRWSVPTGVEVLGLGILEATGIALDDDHVYVSAYTAGGGAGVRRFSKTGDGQAEVIDGCNTAFSVTVDDEAVYAITGVCGGEPRLRRYDKSDFATVTDVDDPGLYAYAVYGYFAPSATDLFWISGSAVVHAPKNDITAIEELLPAPGVSKGLALAGTTLYAAFGADLHAVGIDGSSHTLVATGQFVESFARVGIATDAEHVYWVAGALEEIVRMPLGGGDTEVLASGQTGATGLALDATHVYWSSSDGTIKRLAKP
jgi:hypothetical protein